MLGPLGAMRQSVVRRHSGGRGSTLLLASSVARRACRSINPQVRVRVGVGLGLGLGLGLGVGVGEARRAP